MKAVQCVVVLFFLCVPSTLLAVGFAHDESFIVYAPDQELADQVLAKAGEFRRAESRDLLGMELEPNAGRTIITVRLSETADGGFTWPIDHPDRKFHNMWLTTSRERAAGSTLRHEIRHVVLNTRFPERLPLWIEEGLASRGDDPERQQAWREAVAGFSQTGWPSLQAMIEARSIPSTDKAAYAVSTSLVNYLLMRGDTAKLLQFAVIGKQSGWDHALAQCYGIPGLSGLESRWHAWAEPQGAP